jgi:hypothetical protein
MKKPEVIQPGNYGGIIVNSACCKLASKFKPMDFFCTQGAGFIGWGIRQITKNLSSDRECEFNHAGLLPEGNECTLEALWHIETKNLFIHYEGSKILIGRYNKMNKESARKALIGIRRHIDQSYPKRRLFFHLLNLAHHIHWIDSVVCSEFVAKALYYAGARGHHYWGTTPDNLADEIEHELNKERTGAKYDIIYKGKLPWMLYKFCPHCRTIDLVDIVINRCVHCMKHYLDDIGIPDRDLQNKIKGYNRQKIEYIGSIH